MKSVILAPTPRNNINELDYDIEVINTVFEIPDVKVYYLNTNLNKKILDFLKERYKNHNFEFFELDLNKAPEIFPPSRTLITDFSTIAPFYSLHTGNYSIFYIPGFKKDFYSVVPDDFKKIIDLKEISFFANNKEMLKGMVERLLEYGDINNYIEKFVKESIL